jgi:excisionase family DNA binding protein
MIVMLTLNEVAIKCRKSEKGYTIPEVAKMCGKSRRTINRWIAENKLPVVRMSHNSVYIRPVDLDRAFERRLSAGPAPGRRKSL